MIPAHISCSVTPAFPTRGPACLTRICRIHELLAAGRPVNAESLAREWEISARTIKRDIDLMRVQFDAPIEWDASRKTHRYTRPYELSPATVPRITADEALALILASRTFPAWRGSSLGRALAAALEKMRPVLGDSLSIGPDELSRLIYEPATPGDCETEAERRHLSDLLDAIRNRRVIRITYQKPKARGPAQRTIHPLHLAILDHRWMLVAHDATRRDLRNFLLARIKCLHPVAHAAPFTPPPGFDASAYLSGSFGLFTGEKLATVRIHFDAFAAPYIRERRWHPSQTLRELPRGQVEATMRLNNLIDVRRWILGWGRHARALAPAALVRAIKAEAAATLAHHVRKKQKIL
jgi:predicted DNA-binding transcriptional regulator YafY